jgi:meckelin
MVATDVWSQYNLYLLMILTSFLFFAYKFAAEVTLLLPEENTKDNLYSTFKLTFFLVIVTKTISVLFKIYNQATADIFILDWEESRLPDYNPLQAHGLRVQHDKESTAPIFWRSCFVANELNELQTGSRKIHPETTLLWFSFFWITVGWRWWAQSTPIFEVVDNPLEPENLFLKFFICSSLFMLIAGVQFIICHLMWVCMQENGGDASGFSQLCSVSNCSVLIFDQKFHGYYIHGKATWGKSDIPLAWLYEKMQEEPRNNSTGNTRSFGENSFNQGGIESYNCTGKSS